MDNPYCLIHDLQRKVSHQNKGPMDVGVHNLSLNNNDNNNNSMQNMQSLASSLQVHGAFAGYSGITVGICNTHYVYLPIPEVITSPRFVNPDSRMWHRCLTSTGQPDFL